MPKLLTDKDRLIAIMLGRLEMDVDQCITTYNELMKTVFEERARRYPINFKGKVKALFVSSKLKSAVERVVSDVVGSETEPFNDGKSGRCRV